MRQMTLIAFLQAQNCTNLASSWRHPRSRTDTWSADYYRHDERLGLGATYSTSYYEPFHVARLFATLDLMTEGRAAWNVVTSLNDGEAQNMGRDEVIEHDLRYDRADEFMEVVFGHWNAWEDDAIVQDKQTGLFAEPSKVRRLDHQGRFYRSRGP